MPPSLVNGGQWGIGVWRRHNNGNRACGSNVTGKAGKGGVSIRLSRSLVTLLGSMCLGRRAGSSTRMGLWQCLGMPSFQLLKATGTQQTSLSTPQGGQQGDAHHFTLFLRNVLPALSPSWPSQCLSPEMSPPPVGSSGLLHQNGLSALHHHRPSL